MNGKHNDIPDAITYEEWAKQQRRQFKIEMPIVPMPCVKVKERTLKEWLAKLDEEVNEFKYELIKCYTLDDVLEPIDKDDLFPLDKDQLADEGSDVCVVIHSICQRVGVGYPERADSQNRTNFKNLQRGRL